MLKACTRPACSATTPSARTTWSSTFRSASALAFDADKGRLWAVCTHCGRWNLSPLEERWEAIEECERLFRGTFVRVSTDNVGLARLRDGLDLIRIGAPLRPEFAAWRYGRNFGLRRRRTHVVAGATIAAAAVAGIAIGPTIAPALALGALSIVVVPGITTVMGAIPIIGALAARDYIQHDRVVARLTQRTARAHRARQTPRRRRARRCAAPTPTPPTLAVPHDGGWTEFEGAEAIHATSVLIAGANRFGAGTGRVQDAVRQIEHAGDATGFLSAAANRNAWRGGRIDVARQPLPPARRDAPVGDRAARARDGRARRKRASRHGG